ncbi:MAG: hypothetical protein AB1558_05240 [Thermodesulfobacteriota bacterium]
MGQEIRLLEEEIRRLKTEKEDREAAVPPHSIRPHQLMVIEDLENEISRKEAQLQQLIQKGAS